MAESKNIFFCLSLLVCFVAVKPQLCTPGPVNNITFTSANRLQWTVPTNASLCTISAYVVNVFDSEDQSQRQYQTTASVLHVDWTSLDMCKSYGFEVHALSNQYVLGPSERINATVSPVGTLNLALNITNATLNADTQISLRWNPINTAVERCISYYRVVYWDENNNPTDNYIPATNFTLRQAPVPCMEYKFQVSAIVQSPDLEGPVANVTYDGYAVVSNPPKLENIVTTNRTATMTWSVPTFAETRCPLIALQMNTLGAPANITNVRIPIQDSPLRPRITIYLAGLTPNTVYISHVYLQNSVGPSNNVTATFQTSDSFVFNYETDLYYED